MSGMSVSRWNKLIQNIILQLVQHRIINQRFQHITVSNLFQNIRFALGKVQSENKIRQKLFKRKP